MVVFEKQFEESAHSRGFRNSWKWKNELQNALKQIKKLNFELDKAKKETDRERISDEPINDEDYSDNSEEEDLQQRLSVVPTTT